MRVLKLVQTCAIKGRRNSVNEGQNMICEISHLAAEKQSPKIQVSKDCDEEF